MKIRIALISVAVALGIALAAMVLGSLRDDRRMQAERLRLSEKIQPYQYQIEQIKQEQRAAEETFFRIHDRPRLIPGVRPVAPDDLGRITGFCEKRKLTPVLVLDCQLENCAEIIDAASGWGGEVMLTASHMDRSVNETVREAAERVDEAGLNRSDVFLLRSDDAKEGVINMLSEDGFSGFTVYNSAVDSGMREDGMVWFNYIFFRSTQNNLSNWISSLVSNSGALLVTVDMEFVNNGTLPEQSIDSLLNDIDGLVRQGQLSYADIAEVKREILLAEMDEDARSAAFEEYRAELQQRIDTLNGTIEEIYSEWEGEVR